MLKRQLISLAVVICVLAGPRVVPASIITVDCVPGQGDFPTIGQAIAAAVDGDTISVHPCVYNENLIISGFMDLHLVAAGVGPGPGSLVGSQAAGVQSGGPPSPVVIDGTGLPGPCVAVVGSEGTSIVGFRIRNCTQSGIVLDGASSHTVVHANRIEQAGGGGIVDSSKRARIIGNLIIFGERWGVIMEGAEDGLLADNVIGANEWNGVFLVGNRYQVVNNFIVLNNYPPPIAGLVGGLDVAGGQENRIERNSFFINFGPQSVRVSAGAVNTDLVGNDWNGSFLDLGVGTEERDND